jgi:hypothetical protein
MKLQEDMKQIAVCSYPSYALNHTDKYQYGCEFEFYIDTTEHKFNEVIDNIVTEIHELTDVEILVDTINLPTDKDKNNCIQIKPDISLEDSGIEISVPITTALGIEQYIKTICPIISKYGYTNEETGFHIHISTINNDGINFNFYKFMLLCDKAKLLSSWEPRIGYSQNVMDILSSNTKQESRQIKTKKGTIWNVEKIEPNHVEIKSIGGKDYHTKIDLMINEFREYCNLFDETLQKDRDEHKQMYREHKRQIEKLSKEVSADFVSALSEAGIIE